MQAKALKADAAAAEVLCAQVVALAPCAGRVALLQSLAARVEEAGKPRCFSHFLSFSGVEEPVADPAKCSSAMELGDFLCSIPKGARVELTLRQEQGIKVHGQRRCVRPPR